MKNLTNPNKKLFDIQLKVEVDMTNEQANIKGTEIKPTNEAMSKAEKMLEYAREQLSIFEEEFKSYATLSNQMDSDLKIDKIAAQRMYFRFKSIVSAMEKL